MVDTWAGGDPSNDDKESKGHLVWVHVGIQGILSPIFQWASSKDHLYLRKVSNVCNPSIWIALSPSTKKHYGL